MSEYPTRLNEKGQKYWDIYYEYLKDGNAVQLEILADLCYWEQKKEQAIEDLEKIGRDFIAYLDAEKKPKHTQPVAPMNNLKTAQKNINTLREKLFDEELMQQMSKNESKLRSVKNF